MLSFVGYFMVAIMILVNGVSCVYTQTGDKISGQPGLKATQTRSKTKNSRNQKDDNMNDSIFNISETTEKTFPVSSKTTVKIYSFEGEITVKSENTPVVKMRAVKIALDKETADGVKYDFSQQNNLISLSADYTKPERKVTYGKTYFYTKGAYVNWELILPAETDLILETGEGKINVQDIDGEIKISTKDGSISVSNCKGSLNAMTHDGKIQISRHHGSAEVINRGDEAVLVEGDFQKLSVETGGGDVFLGLSKLFGGTIEADTENISVKEFNLKQVGRNEDGWQKYLFGTGNSNIKIQSTTGRISIYPY